jgi:hypothetical protein
LALVKVVGGTQVLGLLTLADENHAVQAVELLSTADGAVKLGQTTRDLWVLAQESVPGGHGLF